MNACMAVAVYCKSYSVARWWDVPHQMITPVIGPQHSPSSLGIHRPSQSANSNSCPDDVPCLSAAYSVAKAMILMLSTSRLMS